MTPLERAKAFIQSRAAKTALKILPLALATVAAVPAAHATGTVVLNPTSASFGGCSVTVTSPCSGSFVLSSSSTTYGSLATQGGVQGAYGTGSAVGDWHNQQSSSYDWTFALQGNDNGSTNSFAGIPLDTLNVSWDFSFALPAGSDLTVNSETLYLVFVNGTDPSQSPAYVDSYSLSSNTGSYQFSGLAGAPVTSPMLWAAVLDVNLSCDDPTGGPCSGLSANGGNGEADWNVNNLSLYGNSVVGTPEPATLTLLFAAVPFLLRKRR